MRKLIAAMKLSVDGKMEGTEQMADWVEAWSDDYGLTPEIDACVLGGKMYPGYERYWTGIQNEPDKPAWITGQPPTAAEREWARFAKQTPHYVLSRTLDTAAWPNTRFLRSFDDIAALKQQAGKDIYLMGGAEVTASLIDVGLVDELRLIVYPLIAGPGRALFATSERRRALELRTVEQLPAGKLRLAYGIS
jgi:dihydrofolate reductase